MAKKKKTTHRRRRVSGFNGGELVTQIAGVAVGVAATGMLTTKVMGKQKPMIQALTAVAAGVAISTFVKSPLGKAAGMGAIAVGVGIALKKGGIMNGIGEADTLSVPVQINGADELSVISGDYAMAGDEDMMSGSDDLSVISGDYAMAGEDEFNS
jgi:hypothetical protein